MAGRWGSSRWGRKRLGLAMGALGTLLVVIAVWAWQGPAVDPGQATPVPVVAPATPVVGEPLGAALSPLTHSPLSLPVSPLTAGRQEQLILVPTMVAEGEISSDTEWPDESDPPDDPDDADDADDPEDPDAPAYAPVYGVRVVNTYPHDPTAFTQGLEFRDGELFEGTGLRGASSLRRVDLETGEVLQKVDLEARYFGEGITVFEDRIFQLTWQARVGFIYDRETFELLGTVSYSTEGWGLTHDGERLIMSDGTANLTFRDPETFAVLDTVPVMDGGDLIVRLNELQYIDGEVWANVWLTERIARIDPATGQVLSWLNLAGLLDPNERVSSDAVLNGIAYDATTARIFVTGKLWPTLFEIEALDLPQEPE